MAYIDITSALTNTGTYRESTNYNGVSITTPITGASGSQHKFVSSTITGNMYPEEIRGTCFQSNNAGVNSSTAMAQLTLHHPYKSEGIGNRVKVLYVCCAQTGSDYAMFGMPDVSLRSGSTVETSGSSILANTQYENSMSLKEVEYVNLNNAIGSDVSTTFRVLYRKNNDNINVGLDKLVFKVLYDRIDAFYYYYGYSLSIRGYSQRVNNYYQITDEQKIKVYFDGLELDEEAIYGTLNQDNSIYFWISGSTMTQPPDPTSISISYEINGHEIGTTIATLYSVTGYTESEVNHVSQPASSNSYKQTVYARQFMIGLGVFNSNNEGYSHFKVSLSKASKYISGNTGIGGYVRKFSSAFTESELSSPSFAALRSDYQSMYSNNCLIGIDSACDYSFGIIYDAVNSGMAATLKQVKTFSGLDQTIAVTGSTSDLQRTVKSSDVQNSNRGYIVLDTVNEAPGTNEVICWPKIRTLGQRQSDYFEDDTVTMGPAWSGNIAQGLVIERTNIGMHIEHNLINGNTPVILYQYPAVKIGYYPIPNTDTSFITRTPKLYLTALNFELEHRLINTSISNYSYVDYSGTTLFIASGTSTEPIKTIMFRDSRHLDPYFQTNPLTGCTLESSFSLNEIMGDTLFNMTFDAVAGNDYYVYFKPCIMVSGVTANNVIANTTTLVASAEFTVPKQTIPFFSSPIGGGAVIITPYN